MKRMTLRQDRVPLPEQPSTAHLEPTGRSVMPGTRITLISTTNDRSWLLEVLTDVGNVTCLSTIAPGEADLVTATLLVIFAENAAAPRAVDVVRAARRDGFLAPILVLGSRFQTDVVIAMLDEGADECLRDVPERVELRARIDSLLRRSQGRWSNRRGRPLSLDERRRSVTVNDLVVLLTPSQFSLLHYLIERAGEWCRPESIMGEVLGARHYKGTSLVRFHIHQLRRALGDAGAHISWERGKGYMFSNELPADGEVPSSGTHRVAGSSSGQVDS